MNERTNELPLYSAHKSDLKNITAIYYPPTTAPA